MPWRIDGAIKCWPQERAALAIPRLARFFQQLMPGEQRATERRIQAAKFPVLKSLETFEFRAIPSLNKRLVLELSNAAVTPKRNVSA